GDPDFSMEVTGGASDDRFNFDGLVRKDSVTIDGEGGSNTVELTTDTGTDTVDGEDAFAGFDNIDKLVVAGGGSTQDVVEGNMLGLENITIATDSDTDTTIRQLEADTEVTISGKNQTAGTGNSNNDQLFGDIVIEDAQGDAVTVGLENTARADGHLQVETLAFDGGETESVTIDSGATSERDQTNSIQDFQGSDVNNIDVTGTQDLAMGMSDGGGTGKVSVSELSAIDFDASALSGDMALALDADLLTSGDSFVGSDAPDSNDTIAFSGALAEREFDADAGSDGQNVVVENDTPLTLGSGLTVDGVTGVNAAAPTITNIENVWFGTTTSTDLDLGAFANDTNVATLGGAASGIFSAANVSGQDAFILGNLDGNLILTDLSSNVILDADAFTDQNIWLSAEDPSGSMLDLEIVGQDASVSNNGEDFNLSYGDYGSEVIYINDFDEANVTTGYYGDDGEAGEFSENSTVKIDSIVLNDDLEAAYADPDGDFDDEIATDRDSVTLNIDNSVVGDGSYEIENLNVVRTTELNITAVGAASYMFADIAAAETTDVNLTADGDLSARFSDLLSNGTPPNAGEFVTLDASGVDGDVIITIAEGVLERGATDTLMGSSTGNDLLTFEGVLDLETTVSDFETVGFGFADGGTAASGVVDTSNFSGVEVYTVGNLDDNDIELNNLRDGDNVEISSASGDTDNGSVVKLVGDNTLTGAALDVSYVLEEGATSGTADRYLEVENFETVNIDFAVNDDGNFATFDLNLSLDGDARTLNITGGDADQTNTLTLEDDLPASLTSIDVTGYDNATALSMGDSGPDNTDVNFVIGSEATTIDLAGPSTGGFPWLTDGTNDWNATFKFTDADSDANWEIQDFVFEAAGGASADNYSVLDVSDLGIGSFADLDFDDSGSDLIITEEGGGSDWSITLVGVDNESDVAPSENFIFA
ncbi:MAG: hypothetical protein LC687_06100, partial [Actinobacteria bacterium]|nr:hypothetical protein [Actinomycetota bacterium]